MFRDFTKLGLKKASLPNDIAAPSNWDENRFVCTAVLDVMLL